MAVEPPAGNEKGRPGVSRVVKGSTMIPAIPLGGFMSPSDTESDAPEPAASDDVEAVLVEIEDGVAMLFGKYSVLDRKSVV